jgi:hypothetical protein
MATLNDEIKAAEKKMRQAYDALIEYVERPASQPTHIKLHRLLADDLTLAHAHYVTLGSKLKPSS